MKRTTGAILIALFMCLLVVFAAGCAGKTFTVTFMNGDETVCAVRVAEGEKVYEPELGLTGYKAVGWYKNADLSGEEFVFSEKITEDLTLYVKTEAVPETKSFTVRFMDGKKEAASVKVAEGEKVYEPELPTSEDVTVEGWYASEDFSGQPFDFSTAITADLVLYAKVSANLYSVTYNLGGAEGELPVQESVNLDGSFTVKEAVLREGYRFLGWTDGISLYQAGDTYKVGKKSDIVLTATWEYIEVTVNFLDDKSEIAESRTVPYGSDVIAPESIEHSVPWAFGFVGWDESVSLKDVRENLEVKAVFEYNPSDEKYFVFTESADGASYSVAFNEEFRDGSPENVVIPREYNGKPVTVIDEEGFIYVESLRLYVPGSIETIKSVGIYQWRSLTEIVLEEGVKRLETFAIASCYELPSVTLPASLDYIGFNVFYRCYGLAEINVAEGNPNFKYEDGFLKSADGTKLYNAVYTEIGESVTIGSEVKWIAPGLFCDDDLLKTVVIDADLDYLGCGLFYQSGVESVTINGKIREIHGYNEVYTKYPELSDREQYNMMPYGAFENASSLQSITFRDGLEFIGGGAFTWCSITEIVLPYSVKEIAIDAFTGNSNLESIRFTGDSEGARYYADRTSALIEKNDDGDLLVLFAMRSPLTEYTIPDTVSTVNYYAFQDNANLEKLVIPEGVFDLQPGCFINMSSLEYVSIPSTVTALRTGYSPFADEEGMPVWGRVQLWGSGRSIFTYCNSLKEIVYPNGNNITVIQDAAFYGVPFTSFTISAKLKEFASTAIFSDVLEEWIVEEGCTLDYSAENGVLYNGDKSVLISYPANKADEEFVMPSTVKTVEMAAFIGCTSLKRFTFGESYTDIGENVISYCSALETVIFHENLKSISATAIIECKNLKFVEFKGSEVPSFVMGYDGFGLFRYTIFDDEQGYMYTPLPDDLEIKVPVSSYIDYYSAFFTVSGALDYSERISTEGQSLVSYVFDSKGGSEVPTIETVVLTELVKPEWKGEGTKYFYGWYLTDGTVKGNEWGEKVEIPFAYTEGPSVTLYARWEDTRLQDGRSWDTMFNLSENGTFTINYAGQTTFYFCFTATETGKLIDGTNGLPFHSEVLEALASGGEYRVWAMLYTQPVEDYEYMISRSSRYVTAGETYYMTLELYRNDGQPINLPFTAEIAFEVDTSKVAPTAADGMAMDVRAFGSDKRYSF